MTVFQVSTLAYVPQLRKCLGGLEVDHRDMRKGTEFLFKSTQEAKFTDEQK